LGGPEIIFIFVLALLLFGPRKLPQIGRTVGKTLSELRKATHEFRSTLEHEIDTEQVPAPKNDLQSVAKTAHDAASEPAEKSAEKTEPEPNS
jgi:Tat protein translocase TatB subunit